jgi:Ca2+-binding RTX toxin-like protein
MRRGLAGSDVLDGAGGNDLPIGDRGHDTLTDVENVTGSNSPTR